ncbi:MAG: hypothetical protein ACK4HR_01180 [Hyphomonas sp.]|jgi:hypothetical protein
MTIFFWILLATVAFAILLAAQMRMLLSIALRRALAARFGGKPTDSAYRSAIYLAGRDEPDIDETKYLHTEFPRPLAHLTLARRVSLVAPALLLGVFLLGRFGLGVV